MSKKQILIVGGAGYVGGHLTDILSDYDITVYDNLLYEERYLKPVNFVHGDVRDGEKLKNLELNKYDAVIWLAAVVGDGACAVNIEYTKEVNVDSLKWLVDHYDGKIIYMSTCSVYGINPQLLTETSETNPLSLYARTKLDCEAYIKERHDDWLIFRLGTLHGVGDTYSRPRLDLVVNILSYKAATGQPLSVFGGEQWRPLLHVKDVGNAILFGLDKQINGLHNLVDENHTIAEVAEKIKEIIPNTEIAYEDIPFEDLRDYRVKRSNFNKLGFEPQFSLEDAVIEMRDLFYQKRLLNPENPIYYNVNYMQELEEKGKLNEFPHKIN